MALHMPVQKDIGEYEEKIVGKMTLRTIACLALGFGSAIAAGPSCASGSDSTPRRWPSR